MRRDSTRSTPPLALWCDDTATVDEVAELMLEAYVRHVLLVAYGQLVGIVSARDLLGAYAMAPE